MTIDPKDFRLESLADNPFDAMAPKPSLRAGRKFEPKYIRVPSFWRRALSSASRIATFKIAHWLLNEYVVERHMQKYGWRPRTTRTRLALANERLGGEGGVSRREKARALAELEELGLIAVERRARKSPIIELLKLHELET